MIKFKSTLFQLIFIAIKSFLTTSLFLHPLKTRENHWFSGVLGGIGKDHEHEMNYPFTYQPHKTVKYTQAIVFDLFVRLVLERLSEWS